MRCAAVAVRPDRLPEYHVNLGTVAPDQAAQVVQDELVVGIGRQRVEFTVYVVTQGDRNHVGTGVDGGSIAQVEQAEGVVVDPVPDAVDGQGLEFLLRAALESQDFSTSL